jgi:NAD(P)-dependent dehydrogenase (short-subunit alcohol dehydrogenase family)
MTDRITSPFGNFTPAREVVAGHDLTGKVAVVTGSASGIGVETARALAEAGAEVILAVRNASAGAEVAADIAKTAKGAKPRVELVDLSDFSSIRAFGQRWGAKPLNILINNAGVMACPQTYTVDDLEMQIGTNHFGHYLFSLQLAQGLVKGAQESGSESRLVSLSSIAHRMSAVDFEDPHYRTRPYQKWQAYGQAKTANSLFAVGFHQRFRDQGVIANAVMPGGIMTPLQRHLPREEMIAMGWMDEAGKVADGFKTTEQGASTSVWAAVGPELTGIGGLYLENCAQAIPASKDNRFVGVEPWALDADAAEKLWDLSVKTCAIG